MFPVLQYCPLFSGVDTETVNELLGRSSYMVNRYKKDELIARRDMAYSGLLIIVEGSIRGTVTLSDGREQTIDTLLAGQLIAPAFLFGGYNRLPINVYADEDTKIMTLHRGSLFEMMQDNTVVMSNFIDIISNRANYFSRKIYTLTVLMLKEKAASYLLSLAPEQGELKLDIQSMALAMDATRESCIQAIAELEKKGLVSLKNDKLTIINHNALQELGN